MAKQEALTNPNLLSISQDGTWLLIVFNFAERVNRTGRAFAGCPSVLNVAQMKRISGSNELQAEAYLFIEHFSNFGLKMA